MTAMPFAPVPAFDPELRARVQQRIDSKTKPKGSLGRLEELALQLALVQGQEAPDPPVGQTLIFAGDHGAAKAGISAYPAEVTAQMVQNFLEGGAAINVLSRLFDLEFCVVDSGVATKLEPHPRLLDHKIAPGTRNYIEEPAMSLEQAQRAIERGAQTVLEQSIKPSVLVLGEMGIGNTSSASLLTHCITQKPLDACVGRGTGLCEQGLIRKRELLQQAMKRGQRPEDPMQVLCEYGGFEGAMMVGAMIQAASQRSLVLVDGFIVTASALIACELCPSVRPYLVFSHRSQEVGHQYALEYLSAEPLLDLSLALGEGSGAALAYPLIQAAAAFLREMASFESAGVSEKRDSGAST